MDTLELESRVEQLVEAAGFHLISARWTAIKRRAQLRVVADAEDHNISIQECVELSRSISDLLDRYPHEFPDYRLEVSSPGLNRPLEKWQLPKNLGRAVEARFELEGKHQALKGKLIGADEEKFTIDGNRGPSSFNYLSAEIYVLPIIT